MKEFLTPGTHELRIRVVSKNGPAVLLAYSKALKIATGPDWEASMDGLSWIPVMNIGEMNQVEVSQRFPTPRASVRALVPLYLPLVLLCFFSALFFPSVQNRYPRLQTMAANPSMVRWVLLGAWALLGVNNITKIPLNIGFDVEFHYDYISYILDKGTLPLATEGWQMFQSPLYYLISALLQFLLSPFFSENSVQFMLRSIPLVCGALQVQLTYQALRYVFPARKDLQVLGTVLGGLLPMNLYISQTVGNEPLAGVLSAAAIVLVLGIMHHDAGPVPKRKFVFLGIVAGLALLAKVTALLLIPAIVLAVIHVMARKGEPAKRITVGILTVLLSVVVVSGWYYLRNWIELGTPFIGGWDASRGIVWWQDPGYRTIRDFISFGRSLTHPVYSAVAGFWDSIYSTFWMDGFIGSETYEHRPPWNYQFMLSGALLSLPFAVAMLAGFMTVISRPRAAQPGQLFSAYCIALFFAALLYLYATVPIYSTAKATYTLGLIPCYAIIGVTGLDVLSRNRYGRAIAYALLICWAVAAYSSYFVLS
jgi:hypothetical protein